MADTSGFSDTGAAYVSQWVIFANLAILVVNDVLAAVTYGIFANINHNTLVSANNANCTETPTICSMADGWTQFYAVADWVMVGVLGTTACMVLVTFAFSWSSKKWSLHYNERLRFINAGAKKLNYFVSEIL